MAEGAEDRQNSDLVAAIEDGVNKLIGDDLENIYTASNGQDSFGFATLKEFIISIANGQGTKPGVIFNLIWGALKNDITGLLAGFLSIIGITLLYGVSKNVSGGLMGDATGKIIYYVVYGGILATYFTMLAEVVQTAHSAVNAMVKLSEITFPIMVTLMTALGGTSSATLMSEGAYIFGSSIMGILTAVIFPLFYGAMVLGAVGNLSDNLKLGKLTSAVSSVAKWCIGLVFGGFSTIISIIGVTGSGIDSVSIRSARFALSGYVPILGGYLSDGFDVVLGSALAIKNSFGLCVVLVLLAIGIVPSIKIIALMLMTKLTSGITEAVAGGRLSAMFSSMARALEILIAIVLGTAFCIFVMLFIAISTCSGGVI